MNSPAKVSLFLHFLYEGELGENNKEKYIYIFEKIKAKTTKPLLNVQHA